MPISVFFQEILMYFTPIVMHRAIGYHGEELASASPRDMEQYYATEEIEKYGVVGIRIKLI